MSNVAEINDVGNDTKEHYFIAQFDTRDARILKLPKKAILLLVLRGMAKQYRQVFPRNKYLSEIVGTTENNIAQMLLELESDGFIKRRVTEKGRHFDVIHGVVGFENYSPTANTIFAHSEQHSPTANTIFADNEHRHSPTANIDIRSQRMPLNNILINNKEIKKEEEREEHPSGAVASLPRPSASDSDFSSDVSVGRVISETETTTEGAGLSKTETVGVAETNSVNLQAMVAQAVKAELEKSALSFPALTTHSETRTTTQQGQEGAKMEPTEAAPPVVSKPKAPKATRPARLGIEDEIPEAERQIALSQLAEWLPTLQIKPDFRTEKLGKALQAFVIRRREKYLKRIKGFEEPLTRLGLQCQLTKAQKWGYEKCLESIWTAAGEGWKGFFEPRPTNQNGTYKTFKQLDEERAEESLKAWAERKQAEVKH